MAQHIVASLLASGDGFFLRPELRTTAYVAYLFSLLPILKLISL